MTLAICLKKIFMVHLHAQEIISTLALANLPVQDIYDIIYLVYMHYIHDMWIYIPP